MYIYVPTKGQYSTTRPKQTWTNIGSHIRSLLPNRSRLLVPLHQTWIYMVGKKLSGKADLSTLASGGSEHAQLFSVAINCISVCMRICQVFTQIVTFAIAILYNRNGWQGGVRQMVCDSPN